jgi:hypothetical protein
MEALNNAGLAAWKIGSLQSSKRMFADAYATWNAMASPNRAAAALNYGLLRGASAALETTGLAVQALLKSGEAPATARKALNYMAARKDSFGTSGTTQATIMALRALLLSMEKSSAEARGTVEITLNGKPEDKLLLTPENNDLFHEFVLKGVNLSGSNDVAIHFEGEGGLAYQVTGQYFVPWTARTADEPLSIDVNHDRTRLAEGDIASATATITSLLPSTAIW